MRKLPTVAGAAAGLVLALVTSTPLMAQHGQQGESVPGATLRDGDQFDGHARTDRASVRFEGGIGVQPVAAGTGQDPVAETVNRNIVRGVEPAAEPWRIRDLSAKVNSDGRIMVRGTGLVFAGGDTIGTAVTITPTGETAGLTVFATLICENIAPFVDRSTAAVPLGENGDFAIDDVLSSPPSDSCATPVLLIRNEANQAWFAAGVQRFAKD